MQNSKKKKLIKNVIFFIIIFPPFFFMLPFYLGKDFYISPQLSAKTVLSLSDNLSNLEITGKSNFKNDKFHLKLCKDEGCYPFYRNRAIAYIQYKNIVLFPVDLCQVEFYYDTIDNCSKYYEISYNPETNKALCINGRILRTNPFSAKIVKTNNQNTIF